MKMMKTLALAASLLVGGVAAASAAVVTRDLNVRAGPGTNFRIIGALPGGSRVDVGGCQGNWCQVAGGWVSASYLAGGNQTVMVNPNYVADDVALGVGAFALGAVAGSAWGPGWGGGYYGPGWGWGPRPIWWGRPGWGPGRPGWGPGRPGWGPGRPGWGGPGRPGWGGPGRPGWGGPGRPGWGGPGRPGWGGGRPGMGPRPMYVRGGFGGGGRGFGGFGGGGRGGWR
ncbi:SH3 domain-containing protein [Ancylobacter sp.]|uniref:SH3 domain-containing protein n=1 Tax=Ancylobacter sp. TaxID=1872567 RepID=UPI003D0B86D2